MHHGGKSDGTPGSNAFREISPSCFAFTYTPSPCDPGARFIAPFEADLTTPNLWIAGGRYVWINNPGGVAKGWDTHCGSASCDWQIRGDSGAGHSITQVAMTNGTWYAAWCGPCNSAGFARGILKGTSTGGAQQLNCRPRSRTASSRVSWSTRTMRITSTSSSAGSPAGGRARSRRAKDASTRRPTVEPRGVTSAATCLTLRVTISS